MAVVVDLNVFLTAVGRKDEDKDNDHQRSTPNLAFHCRTDKVKAVPVNDYISEDNSDDSVERRRGSSR